MFGRHGAHRQHSVGMRRYARTDSCPRPDPNAVLQMDLTGDQIKRRFFVVVVTGQQHGALGKTDMIAEDDRHEIVNPDALTDPAVIAYRQEPGVFDIDTRLDENAPSDPGAEPAQQGYLQPREGIQGVEEEKSVHQIPKADLQAGSAGMVMIVVESG